MRRLRSALASCAVVCSFAACSPTDPDTSAAAAPIRVAVAANFAGTMERIAAEFQKQTGVVVEIVPGATGRLAAQIGAGAPFDVFLAADHETVLKLVGSGRLLDGTQAVYALGQLALYGPGVDAADGPKALQREGLAHVAIANPELAPYGVAAREVLDDLGALEKLKDRLVFGENVGQALTFVDTGAAELGFLAYGQVIHRQDGRAWLVPEHLHAPLRQDLGVVQREGAHPRARELRDFILGDAAQGMIEADGYLRAKR